ncbi:MAG: rhodanese-like domain-containing protein [Ignavibacteriaceae bacterium]|nr:rhodanese-like domain-containing protein [Ignavibacterium sp.]MCC6256305.1 rhodanese-like domain-containing protein [Ignavibacteriaceae bacterium]HMN23528.1 rhodanese-like domain-containing protein [Ignavibacteriaceae bacterium]HRN27011.1 rhodanese-like domain-containing protein [Ignavibacteriaceae bacterium]HRP93134.1 rhodanese-like domain-containing protein [Ignavibacteriaceae bacterium]
MNQLKNFIILFVVLISVISCAQQNPSNSYTMEQFKEKLKSDKELIVLDVRTPEELAGPLGKIDGAINIPVQVLESRLSELEKYKNKEIAVICRTQNRSSVAANILSKKGYNAKYVLGGMTAFQQK